MVFFIVWFMRAFLFVDVRRTFYFEPVSVRINKNLKKRWGVISFYFVNCIVDSILFILFMSLSFCKTFSGKIFWKWILKSVRVIDRCWEEPRVGWIIVCKNCDWMWIRKSIGMYKVNKLLLLRWTIGKRLFISLFYEP